VSGSVPRPVRLCPMKTFKDHLCDSGYSGIPLNAEKTAPRVRLRDDAWRLRPPQRLRAVFPLISLASARPTIAGSFAMTVRYARAQQSPVDDHLAPALAMRAC
jgi:hypothetical protein